MLDDVDSVNSGHGYTRSFSADMVDAFILVGTGLARHDAPWTPGAWECVALLRSSGLVSVFFCACLPWLCAHLCLRYCLGMLCSWYGRACCVGCLVAGWVIGSVHERCSMPLRHDKAQLHTWMHNEYIRRGKPFEGRTKEDIWKMAEEILRTQYPGSGQHFTVHIAASNRWYIRNATESAWLPDLVPPGTNYVIHIDAASSRAYVTQGNHAPSLWCDTLFPAITPAAPAALAAGTTTMVPKRRRETSNEQQHNNNCFSLSFLCRVHRFFLE
jgi:hypothetical protein